MPESDALDSLLDTALGNSSDNTKPSRWSQRHFLNPDVPYALRDDPDGTYHAKKQQIRKPNGEPIRGLKKDEKIQLALRPYQRQAMDVGRKWRALRWARRCMVAGTPVLMGDGRWKPIDEIETGDHVACRDDHSRIVSKPVTETYENDPEDVYEVTLSNGRSVTCTSDHPFLALESRGSQGGDNKRVWKSLDDGLSKGDRVVSMQQTDRSGDSEACHEIQSALEEKDNGRHNRGENRWMYPRVASVEHKGQQKTYDIQVDRHHNFIANGMVVHNCGKSYQIGIEVFYEALTNSNAQVLVLAPSQNQVKVIFDDYLRPLLRTYDHRISGKVGISEEPAEVGSTADFAIIKDTQKPQELVIVGEDDHRATIRGMVISDSARGQSADFLVVDEADYADSEDMEQIVGPIMMTDPNTRMLMVSTPSGKGDTFFRDACNSSRWWSDHNDFTALPHYDEDLWDQMAEMAGGESTNTFKREYLAQWGSTTEGVFDQEALEKSYIISPYPLVMEEMDRRKGTREPMLAADRSQHAKSELAAYNGVRPLDYDVNGDPAGARSVYRSKHRGRGVITAGTDWNDLAGMQTVLIWWPPPEMINNGEVEVSRFPEENGAPVTTRRAKNEQGEPRRFKVGQKHGSDYHNLSATEGIVIWHGRLESGRFTWASAANRVCSMMGVDDFINAWYVDRGYGVQVNQMIKQIMESGEYIPDQRLLTQSRDVDESVLRNMNRFHPDRDPEVTGRIYRTIRFGENYDHREIDHAKGQGNYKNIMINLLQRMVEQHRLLFPYGALTGKLGRDDMGERTQTEYNLETREEETVRTPVTEDDDITENGAAPSRGDDAFGGLLTQMQTTKVDGYTPQGKPRYKGDWHAVDAIMLATLAYWENYSDQFGGNMFNPEVQAEGRTEEDIFSAANEATESARRDNERFKRDSTKREGPFSMPSYNDAREPLEALADGRKTSEEVGTSMDDMIDSAQQWWNAGR